MWEACGARREEPSAVPGGPGPLLPYSLPLDLWLLPSPLPACHGACVTQL
jgi:hypothetical protein